MQEETFKLPLVDSYKSLQTVQGIQFTPREVDIIACIINGRASTKTIASFLSIQPKTVEAHTHNIRTKLECNSRDGIFQFIEKAGKFSAVREHYLSLSLQSLFTQKLRQISNFLSQKSLSVLIAYEKDQEFFVKQLGKDLQSIGIEVTFDGMSQEAHETYFSTINLQQTNHIVFICSSSKQNDLLIENGVTINLLNVLKQKETITLISLGKNFEEEFFKKIESYLINFSDKEKYYFSFFNLLKRIIPKAPIEKLILELKEHYDTFYEGNSSEKSSLPLKSLWDQSNISCLLMSVFKRQRGFLIGSIGFCIIALGTTVWISKNNTLVKEVYRIRSDLPLPHDTTLLQRSEIMKQIEEKLNRGNQEIQTVALVGVGGAGKTTIARAYARQQQANVIWEINAETQESLKDSFDKLSYALAQTEKEKKTLRELQAIKNQSEKEEKILSFTREKLKKHLNWFLLYDNVEMFSDIQHYFPSDFNTWGHGKVIITTRDINIKNRINNIIPIISLSDSEKSKLFSKIMGDLLFESQQEQTKKFLTSIPPFPLDVSVAAYYLKTTNVSYERYLESLTKHTKEFENTQLSILKEANEYTKTRYMIIVLSLKTLLKIHKDFQDLLFLLSLMDFQKIPVSLLDFYKESSVVDNFIYFLKKYSLVTDEFSNRLNTLSTISVHPSTQEISLAYLISTLKLEEKNQALQKIIQAFENYVNDILEKKGFYFSKLIFLANHLEVFSKHNNVLTENLKASADIELGRIYFHLGNYTKAKPLLEQSLVTLRKDNNENDNIARALMILGKIHIGLGYYEESKNLLEHSLSIYEKLFPLNLANIAQILIPLGNTYKELGNHNKAKDFLQKSLSIYKTSFPEKHAGIARGLKYLGNVYRELGNFKQAKHLFEESIQIRKKYFPEDYIGNAHIMVYLGNIYRDLSQYKESKSILEQSLSVYKQHLSDNHPYTAKVLVHLGNIYRELGDYEKAKDLLEQSLSIYENSENYIGIGWTLLYLGNIYRLLGDYEKAKSLLEQSLSIYEKYFPQNHIDIARVLGNLGNIYRELENYEKAKDLLEQSLSIYEKQLSKDHIYLGWASGWLGNVYRSLGDYEKAKDLLEKCLMIYKKHFPENSADTGWAFTYLGNVYRNLRNYEKAKDLLQEALTIHQNLFGEENVRTCWVLIHLGNLYEDLGQYEEAKVVFEKSLKVYKKYFNKNHLKIAEILVHLGHVHQNLKDYKKAKNVLEESLLIYENKYGKKHPQTIIVEKKLKDIQALAS